MFEGIAASKGIGIGKIKLIEECELKFVPKHIDDVEKEKLRFENALNKFKKDTAESAESIRKNIGEKEANILEGHIAMISDPAMNSKMMEIIEGGQCAETAVDTVCDMFINIFSQMEDELMRQRSLDILDIKTSLIKILLGVENVNLSQLESGTILVTKDITPSMISQIVKDNVAGVITEIGGTTSHAAILLRTIEIPTVLSVAGITKQVKDGDVAIVDGNDGVVYIRPEEELLSKYKSKREEYIKKKIELKELVGVETHTKDNIKLKLYCNIGTPKEAKTAIESGGEGIGLFRTEFLFMDSNHLPSETEQYNSYKEAVDLLSDKTIIIRTLDIGGDKDIPYLGLKKECNPFLGYRGIRYCLGNIDIFKIQIRSILRASAFGKVKIMIPLVTCVDEIRAVRKIVEDCKQQLKAEGIEFDKKIEVGCMIETASASLIADILAKEADFFSIGTNDLTQYTMSVDRGNQNVTYLYSAFEPSVIRSIKNIIDCAKKQGIEVGMCGEAAADELMIPLLISFGLEEYSVSPSLALETKSVISKWTKKEADELADKVLKLSTKAEIIKLLQEYKK
ncbi:MAG: phosphoenolpyruvate--protein phosphotransferase [Lachnospiraceae bacterium]|nr:phosphoenolpyruvate--protein phosphotransferase [Lachnospiraceae bacterium]